MANDQAHRSSSSTLNDSRNETRENNDSQKEKQDESSGQEEKGDNPPLPVGFLDKRLHQTRINVAKKWFLISEFSSGYEMFSC